MAVNTNESKEDYLEAIFVLKNQRGAVRSIDIANHFGYSRPSISRAVSILRKDNLISVDESGYIDLTADGLAMAEGVYSRHTTLIEFLMKLGVSEDVAENDACRIEHVLSQESMDRIKEFIDKV